MEYKFNFETEEEKEKLIQDNSHLTLIKIAYHLGESYLIFTDEEIEAENETLKQELSITQDAVNELIFNSLNM